MENDKPQKFWFSHFEIFQFKPKKFDKSNDGVIIIETSQVACVLQCSTMKLLKLKFFLTSQTIFSLGGNISYICRDFLLLFSENTLFYGIIA